MTPTSLQTKPHRTASHKRSGLETATPLLTKEEGLFRFSSNGAELHIQTPETPAPWKNYFFNDLYYLEVDQCGQGQARICDEKLRTLRGPYRIFYLKDEETGEVWNCTGRPLNVALDSYKAVHTPGHSEFHSSKSGIGACVTAFVPTEGSREMWKVTLNNLSDRPRRLSLFSIFPFEAEPLMKARSWYDHESGVCYGNYFPHHHAYAGYEQLKNRRTVNYLFSTRPPVSGGSGERNFFGSDDFSRIPQAVENGMCNGEPSTMDLPVGALHHHVEISPSKQTELGICYGVETDQSAVMDVHRRYATTEAFDDALGEVSAHYEQLSSGLNISTPDEALNGFVNHWLPKQIAFQSRKNRLSDAFPIRNQLQDCMGYSLIDPAAAFDYLLTRVALQQTDGYLRQWWSEGDRDDHLLCSLDFKDAGIWLILCSIIVTYQNGSLDLMNQQVPFRDSDEHTTLFEHLMRAARNLADCRGTHGLCLFGDGDWTDPINGPGRKGTGESTWTTCALGVAVQMLQEVATAMGKPEDATWLEELDASLHRAAHDHSWNGSWFSTGFDDDGKAFGTPEDKEGRIFLNSQTWAIIAGYVAEDRLAKTVDAIRLMETKAGTLMSWPQFTEWNPTWGRISLKQAGTTENGSIYCHANMFKAYAECSLGSGDEALREILRTLPTNPDNPPSHNTQAPIFVPNYYFGLVDSLEFGVSSRHHNTGTAPWMLWVLTEHILGIRATPDGLAIDPRLADAWPEVRLTRRFRDSTYDIILINKKTGGQPVITVDGAPLDSLTLPCGKDSYQVEIRI